MHYVISVPGAGTSPSSSLSSLAASVQSYRNIDSKWSAEYVDLLHVWMDECTRSKIWCYRMSRVYTVFYLLFYLPTIVVPVVVSQLRPYYNDKYTFVLDQMLLLSGLAAGLCSSLNLGGKIQKLNEIDQGLDKISQEIRLELFKPEKVRQQPDLFLVTKMFALQTLIAQVPRPWICMWFRRRGRGDF